MRKRKNIYIIIFTLIAMSVNACETVNININMNTDSHVNKKTVSSSDISESYGQKNTLGSYDESVLERIRSSGVLSWCFWLRSFRLQTAYI